MSFSQSAGTAIIPTLSRLVLALAFITTGYAKLFTAAQFNAEQATVLRNLGVVVSAEDSPVAAGPATDVLPVRLQQAPSPTQPAEGGESAPVEAVDDLRQGEEPSAAVSEPPLAEGTYKAQRLHQVTLLCSHVSWPYPHVLGWIAAITELVGGVLLFFGFFSRLWGLGLAMGMGAAVYLVSGQAYLDAGPLAVAAGAGGCEYEVFNLLFTQLGLFVLALGIFLTGPGPVSVDRLLFGARKKGGEQKSAGEKAA